MQIDLSKIQIREIGTSEVEILTTYRMAYLAELQGEQSEEYQLAELKGEILSFGAMVIKKIPGDFNQSAYLEGDILNMFTVPFARRKGISALILQQLINEARNRGISKVSLHTSKDGEKLYRKFGFSEPVYPVLELCL